MSYVEGGFTMSLVLPEGYDPHMTVRDTQNAIKFIRDTFQKEFGREMNLERISAPLFAALSSLDRRSSVKVKS